MSKKYPQQPQEIFDDYVSDWRSVYAEGLESVIFYGSGARGEYEPGKSDLNFLIVLGEAAINNLRQAINLTEKWRTRARAVPLVVTRQYIHASLDSYPVEFLHMQRHYRVLFGADVLSALKIDARDLRLQLERELKGKLLHLRKGFLEFGYDRDELKEMMRRTITAFLPLSEAFLFLRQETIPSSRQEILQKVSQVAPLETGFINELFRALDGESRPYREELWEIMESYVAQVARLVQIVDAMANA
jgi:predicted nucleotidyltransferase